MTDQNQLIFELTGERPKGKVKPKRTQPQIPTERQGRDFFQTPNYATNLLIPFIPKDIVSVWEVAYGAGKISGQLRNSGYTVFESDIQSDDPNKVFNFLSDIKSVPEKISIITNPPFSLKEKFYLKCLEYGVPFALLIPADYSGWVIRALQNGSEKVIPTRRIDYLTPSGKGSGAQFHSLWLCHGFNIGKSETFVELSIKQKKEEI